MTGDPGDVDGARQKHSLAARVSVGGSMLLAGSLGVVVSKLMYQTKAVGRDGTSHYMEKPLYQTLVMFTGMSLLLFWYYFYEKRHESFRQKYDFDKSSWSLIKLISVPAACDFVASYMMAIALLWLTASSWQLYRGSIIIFSAIFSVTYRKKKLPVSDWVGVVVATLGLTLVGISSVYSARSEGDETTGPSVFLQILGIILVIAAEAVQAFQTIVEEKLLHDDNSSPYAIVGFEGVIGGALCVFISMPIAQFVSIDGISEDSIDTYVQLTNSLSLVLLSLLYMLVIVVFNITGQYVTSMSTAVARNILDSSRPLLIWLGMLFMHYLVDEDFGESWTRYSWLELLGLFVFVVGSFIYNEVIRLPLSKSAAPVIDDTDDALLESVSTEIEISDMESL